jgi:hypothetical protein
LAARRAAALAVVAPAVATLAVAAPAVVAPAVAALAVAAPVGWTGGTDPAAAAAARGATARPDLSIRAVRELPAPGTRLEVRVHNLGVAASPETVLRLYYRQGAAVETVGARIPALAPGASAWVRIEHGKPLTHAGSVTLRADDPNTVPESDELNNAYAVR